jgi:hypothetical protein
MSYGFERLDSNPPPPLLVVIKYDNANRKIMNHAYSSYLSCLRRGPRLDCLLTTVLTMMMFSTLAMFELVQWRSLLPMPMRGKGITFRMDRVDSNNSLERKRDQLSNSVIARSS